MAEFDNTLAELQAKLAAIQYVLDKHPNIEAEVVAAEAAAPPVAVVESEAQDQARANALARTLEATIGKVAPMKHATPVDPDTATKSPSA